MTQITLYTYLGTNGTLTSGIHLEGVPAMIQYKLKADPGKILTDGTTRVPSVTVIAAELDKWTETDI